MPNLILTPTQQHVLRSAIHGAKRVLTETNNQTLEGEAIADRERLASSVQSMETVLTNSQAPKTN